MRKNALALSIATMIGGLSLMGAVSAAVLDGTTANPASNDIASATATALQVAPGGIGHILVVPYFTAQGGNSTIVSLVNTDRTNGKAIKIRFRGAANSDDILDFTILMSPYDVWQGTVDSDGTVARISTNDKTCTIPQLAQGQTYPFLTARLDQFVPATINENTREGYVEIFNMADIRPGSTLFTAIKHSGGTPACSTSTNGAAAITAILKDATDQVDAASKGLATPTTGLMGNWTIINVPQTTTFSGSATAVRALSAINSTTGAVTDGRGNYVLFPQSRNDENGNDPLIVPANVNFYTADPLFRTNQNGTSKNSDGTVITGTPGSSIVAPQFYDFPDLSTPYITAGGLQTAIAGAAILADVDSPLAQASILTTALAVKSILNEYAMDSSVTARTDWIFSMPTRRYSTALFYESATKATPYFSYVPENNFQGTGVNQFFYDTQTKLGVNAGQTRQLCLTAGAAFYTDREEGTQTGQPVFSPQQGNPSVTFCGETSIISFGPAGVESTMSANVARQAVLPPNSFVNGWISIPTVNANTVGLPVLGSSFIKLRNPNATPGTSGTYGIAFDHRYTR